MKTYHFEYEIAGQHFKHSMKLETWEEIKKEFGGLREYLKTMISGKFRIIDHFIINSEIKG